MRVLQVVKTINGAKWAVDQVRELVAGGVEVHVVLPSLTGRFGEAWRETGAVLYPCALDFPVRAPWRLPALLGSVRELVTRIGPDIIHSHFFGPTIVLRYALGRDHPVPRIFQVPGPLHMEHAIYRQWELSCAGKCDYWVASSNYIKQQYAKAGVDGGHLFLSYYGNRHTEPNRVTRGQIRSRLGISDSELVVGNINYMYSPKYFLGQMKGLKRHEDVIDALGLLLRERHDVTGLLLGGQWGGGNGYEERLRRRARRVAGNRILLPGLLSSDEVSGGWHDFDLAVHVPSSENCGGVVEPFTAGVPVIASRVGGLPELVLDGITGKLVEQGQPVQLARAISEVLNDLDRFRDMADTGRQLVHCMFDALRTAGEIQQIYEHLCDASRPVPPEFNSCKWLSQQE